MSLTDTRFRNMSLKHRFEDTFSESLHVAMASTCFKIRVEKINCLNYRLSGFKDYADKVH